MSDDLLLTSTFIDLCDSSNGNKTLPLSPKPIFMFLALLLVFFILSSVLISLFQNFSFVHFHRFLEGDVPHPNVSNKLKIVNYDTIFIQKVPFLLTKFNGDIWFKLLPLQQPIEHFEQMQGMDWKHDGHA